MIYPIENLLDTIQQEFPAQFPENGSYFSRYETAVSKLRNGLYKAVNQGLALLSEYPGLYTDHGAEHFDEVVRYLGDIIPVDQVHPEKALKPYELFVVLMAARIHDVGNSDGRKDHEKRCIQALGSIGDGADRTERILLGRVAEAHGGKSTRGCKDTIGDLLPSAGVFSISVDARKCAALVRIADEICENRKRALGNFDFSNEKIKLNEIHHVYANCITRNTFSSTDRLLTLEFDIPLGNLNRKFQKRDGEKNVDILLIEEIASRLEKLDCERRYCNTYLPDAIRIRGIKVVLKVFDNNSTSDKDYFNSIEITQYHFQDIGYPATSEKLAIRWHDLEPNKFADLVSTKIGVSKDKAKPAASA